MAVHRVVEVTSLSSFAAQIEQALAAAKEIKPLIKNAHNWYRGHGQSSFKLKPSLYRHPTIQEFAGLLDVEAAMLQEFRRQSLLHEVPSLKPNEEERFETLFYMQHYGVPTRLLDWTSNPFIALYFALTDAESQRSADGYRDDASVWILDPWLWNKHALDNITHDLSGPVTPGDRAINSYRPKLKYDANDKANMYVQPVAILGVANTARMFAQKGVFTMFGRSTSCMAEVYDRSNFAEAALIELKIPRANIGNLLDNLLSIGYTDSVTYPDHQGLALEIKRLNGFRT